MNYKVYLVSDWNTSVGNVTMDDTACEIVLSTDVAGFYESKTLFLSCSLVLQMVSQS